jgi:hypothetical protein
MHGMAYDKSSAGKGLTFLIKPCFPAVMTQRNNHRSLTHNANVAGFNVAPPALVLIVVVLITSLTGAG